MGVAGSGKTTVGRQLAADLGWRFDDADQFHPPANVAKMSAGQPLTVVVTLKGAYPVVAYDYSLENRCWFKGRFAGPGDSSESYPLLGPWVLGPGGSALSTQVVDLTPVPAGSVCKVSVLRGGVTVKGTTTPYSVN